MSALIHRPGLRNHVSHRVYTEVTRLWKFRFSLWLEYYVEITLHSYYFVSVVSSLDLRSRFGGSSVDLRKKGFFPKKYRIYRADPPFLDASHSYSSMTLRRLDY